MQGYRTYVSAAVLCVVAVAGRLGYTVSKEWQDTIEVILGCLVAVFLRASISSGGQPAAQVSGSPPAAPPPAALDDLETILARLERYSTALGQQVGGSPPGNGDRGPCNP